MAVRVGSGDRWLALVPARDGDGDPLGRRPERRRRRSGWRGQLQLNPRASFAEYLEHVRGGSAPWSDEQLGVARQAARAWSRPWTRRRLQRNAGIAARGATGRDDRAFPTIPGIDGAARYLPSASDPIGGDWYDVFFRPEGGPGRRPRRRRRPRPRAPRPPWRSSATPRAAYVIREESPSEAMARLNDLM